MAGNRKLPFGYRMEQGEIKEHPVEAEAVRRIFRRYLAGASYAALVEHLRDTGPAYDGDKPWKCFMFLGTPGKCAIWWPGSLALDTTGNGQRMKPPCWLRIIHLSV